MIRYIVDFPVEWALLALGYTQPLQHFPSHLGTEFRETTGYGYSVAAPSTTHWLNANCELQARFWLRLGLTFLLQRNLYDFVFFGSPFAANSMHFVADDEEGGSGRGCACVSVRG